MSKFDNLDPSKMSPEDLLQALKQYRAQEEANAFSAWENTDPPYSIGDVEPLGALLHADCIYLLSDTKMGRPAVMTLGDTRREMIVTLKRNLMYRADNSDDLAFYNLLCRQNNIKREDLILYKCDIRFIKAQMHNFKCENILLIDADDWHYIYSYELEDHYIAEWKRINNE